MFAKTDITSSMMRFVETEHSETCFLFHFTYINRPIYILATFLLAMYTSCDILHAFFQPCFFPTYNFIGIFAKQNFL